MSTTVRRNADAKAAYHHGDLRNALLAAARALVSEGGIDGFGLREVSRRAGVSHTAAYNHFANRSALVEALVIEAFAALTAALRAAEFGATDPLRRLQDVGVAYVRFAYERQAEFRFMFRPEHCPDPGSASVELRAATSAAYAPLADAIAAALSAGAIAGNAQTLALTAWSGVHGLASLIVDGPLRNEALDSATVEALARSVTSTLIGRA
ncbi:MAG: TetR/AcrR family transcriptional regulator [Candidatus Eremiobacteraeota bacterium]|nr:TetR/AcrR family transcriptional regulator [Candidatus Eremiobacteraeota bacterium]